MKQHRLYYAISFTEGAAVMATEIIGAKYLAPLFGSSLYVWSSVMAMTLGGLATGYFYGGRLSHRENNPRNLFLTLFAAGAFILLMPFFTHSLASLSFDLPLLAGVVVCSFCILVPPVFCMGMVSPLIVQMVSMEGESGKRAGEVYAISTVGGILATFLTGFYLIPSFGLNLPLFIFGGLLLVFSLIYFVKKKDNRFLFVGVVVVGGAILNYIKENKTNPAIIYESEGLLGRLEVMEPDWDMDSLQAHEHHRLLLINNIIQTWVEVDSNRTFMKYVEEIDHISKKESKKVGNALVLGLGGGTVANVLRKNDYTVIAVELDQRIIDVAQKYFDLDKDVNVICDDARHAIDRMDDKFDIIVVDLFSGEVTPSHVMSVESIERMKKLLAPGGFIAFNTYGYLKPPAGRGNVSLLKTLEYCGLTCGITMTGDIYHEDYRNMLILASEGTYSKTPNEYITEAEIEQGTVITDNKPVLEAQNALAAKRWRYYYMQNFIRSRKKL